MRNVSSMGWQAPGALVNEQQKEAWLAGTCCIPCQTSAMLQRYCMDDAQPLQVAGCTGFFTKATSLAEPFGDPICQRQHFACECCCDARDKVDPWWAASGMQAWINPARQWSLVSRKWACRAESLAEKALPLWKDIVPSMQCMWGRSRVSWCCRLSLNLEPDGHRCEVTLLAGTTSKRSGPQLCEQGTVGFTWRTSLYRTSPADPGDIKAGILPSGASCQILCMLCAECYLLALLIV